jgi:cysteine desulfurase
MEPYLRDHFHNPSAAYGPARDVRSALDEARRTLASCLGAKPDELILTAGATESINLAFTVCRPDDHVVIGATEHASVRGAAAGYHVVVAASDSKGRITPEAVATAITDQTRLVSVTAADSELGTLQPLRKIADGIATARKDRHNRGILAPLYFHSDASQAAGAIDLSLTRLGVDLLTLSAAKCYGPKQVGLLWARAGVPLRPLVRGGGQERGLRSGTENVAGVIGFAEALRLAQKKRVGESERLLALRNELARRLAVATPDLIVNGDPRRHLPGHLNVSVPGVDAERVVYRLDMQGVYVATGAACAANKGLRSSVLTATGMSETAADGSIRLSLGRSTTEDDAVQAARLITEAFKSERYL